MRNDDVTVDILSKLYDVFGCYPKPERVIGSPVTIQEGDDKPLLAKPLRSLTVDDFGRYPFKAMTTWGTVDDFKYFLPRMLELSFYSLDLFSGATLFDKILYADWSRWKDREKDAVRECLLAMWEDATQLSYQNLQRIEMLVEHLRYFMDDISPLVQAWASNWVEDQTERHFEELVAYLDSNWIAIFYEGKPHPAFLDVILESNLSSRLESAFYEYEQRNPKFAAQISRCEQKLAYFLSTH